MSEIYFVAWGEPKAEARHRTRVVQPNRGRVFARQYQPTQNKQNRAYLRQAALAALPANHVLFDGPLELTVVCWIEQPKSKRVKHPARMAARRLLTRLFPVGRPDCDNLVKLIKDACTSVVWTDDARVVSEHVHKRYTIGRPCTEVHIREMGITGAFDPIEFERDSWECNPTQPTECVLNGAGRWAAEATLFLHASTKESLYDPLVPTSRLRAARMRALRRCDPPA